MRKAIAILILILGSFLLHSVLIRHVYTGDLFFFPLRVLIFLSAGISLILIGTAIWGWKGKIAVFVIVFIVIGGTVLVFGSSIIIYDSILHVLPKSLSLSSIHSIDYKELIIGSASLLIASTMVILGIRMHRHKAGFIAYLSPILIFSLGIIYSSVTQLNISEAYWFTSREIILNKDSSQFFFRTRYFDLNALEGEIKVPIQLLRLKSKGE